MISTHPTSQASPTTTTNPTTEIKLTSQPNIPRNNLQVLRPPQLRTKRTTPLHNLLPQFLIPLVAPIVVVPAAAQDDAALEWAREDVGRSWIDAFGGADVPGEWGVSWTAF